MTAEAPRLTWRTGFTVTHDAAAQIAVVSDGRRAARVATSTPQRRAIVSMLESSDGATVDDLVASVEDGGDAMAAVQARSVVNALASRGLLAARCVDDLGAAALIDIDVLPDEPVPEGELSVPPDVFVRRGAAVGDGLDLALESASDPARSDRIAPRFAGALFSSTLPSAWRAVVAHAGILVPDRSQRSALDQWEFHDRLFHTRSRMWGGSQRAFGATMRLADIEDAEPAIRPPSARLAAPIALSAPASGSGDELSFSQVVDRRRSRRRGHAPVDVDALAALLHGVASVRRTVSSPTGGEVVRTVPSGGALASVELFPLVVDCPGIDPGLYHYDGHCHALRKFSAAEHSVLDGLVASARSMAALDADAPVSAIVILGARFARLQYKYSGMAYATALKDAGVLLHSLYLTGTSLGVAGCALGGGDVLAFERATGLDRWDVGSVGEFLLAGTTAPTAHGDADGGNR